MRAKNLAVMFTDMESFTAKTSKRSRIQIDLLISAHQKFTENAVSDFSGLIIKNLGDGYLIVFDSPTNAVLCATTLQNEIKKYNNESPRHGRFKLRVGIASGDVIIRGGDVFGEPVNLAARILGISEVGSVYFSQSVFLSMNKNEIPVLDLGEMELKGIPEKTKVYRVGKKKIGLKLLLKSTASILSGGSMSRPFRYALIVSYVFLTVSLIRIKSDIVGGVIPVRADVKSAEVYYAEAPVVTPQPTPSATTPLGRVVKNAKGKFKGLLKKLVE